MEGKGEVMKMSTIVRYAIAHVESALRVERVWASSATDAESLAACRRVIRELEADLAELRVHRREWA